MPPAPERLLRMWHQAAEEGSWPGQGTTPHLLWTHARDSTPCSLGACFSLALTPTDSGTDSGSDQLSVGCALAGDFGRRLLARQATELLERCENPSAACVFAAACDGQDIVLLRVCSGMVVGLDPYCGTPCPTDRTPPLPLLRGWDLVGPCTLPRAPPEGFAALMRILRSPPALLNGCTLPLEHVTVSTPLFAGKLELGRRLGCGGSSHVYARRLPGDPTPAVVKLARAGTAAVRALFEAEEATLLSLSAAPRTRPRAC